MDSIEGDVSAKLDKERGRIAATKVQKAKRLVAIDFDQKVKEIAELNDVLKQRDAKLAEAQQAQAEAREEKISALPTCSKCCARPRTSSASSC